MRNGQRLVFISVLVWIGAMPAWAESDDGAPGVERVIEEVVVTATKRPQSLQDTPVAVTVTTQETINEASIVDIIDLQSVVPSLRVETRQTSRAANFLIRGFGGGTNNPGIEPSVGIYVDGVYRSRAAAAIGDLPRIERVEVLGGPQSTLFGKNASAGVVSVVTPKPSGQTGGFIEVGIGNFDAWNVKALYEGAINDQLAFEVSANVNRRDGYVDNVVTGTDLNNRDRYALRGQLLFNPTDSSEFRLIADYSELEEECCEVSAIAFGGMPVAESVIFNRDQTTDIDPQNEVTDWGLSAHLDIDFSNFTFTSITSYRTNDVTDDIDVDQTPLALISSGSNEIIVDTITQEFRVTSATDGPIEWLAGFFYIDEQIEYNQDIVFGNAFRPVFSAAFGGGDPAAGEALFQLVETTFGIPAGAIFGEGRGVREEFDQDNQSFSIFGQVDWHLSPDVTATFGLNYTEDEKSLDFVQFNNDPFSQTDLSGTPFAGLSAGQFLPPVVGLPNVVEDGETDDDDVTYTFRLAYQVNDSINVYASYATGFKASSFTLDRGTRPNDADFAALQAAGVNLTNLSPGARLARPEEAAVVEVCLKARFNRVSLNLAVFDQKIEDFQVFTFVQGARFQAANAEEQSTTGVEFDLTYFPIDALELKLAGTFLDPEFDEFTNGSGFLNPGNPEDLSGETPAAIHETSVSLAATYRFTLGDWAGFVRGDYQYEDEIQAIQNVDPALASREVKMLNLGAGVTSPNGWSIKIWGRNVTDDEYLQGAFPDVFVPGTFQGYLSQPRTYGLTVSKSLN